MVALGRNYRLVWVFLLLSIGVEFAFVAWGAQVAVARNDLGLADATAIASLLPIFWSHRTGVEIMQPLATPVIGGMLSSLLHILLVPPVIIAWLRERELPKV